MTRPLVYQCTCSLVYIMLYRSYVGSDINGYNLIHIILLMVIHISFNGGATNLDRMVDIHHRRR